MDKQTASIDLAQLDSLEALAQAATRGPWKRSDRPNGPFWHISSEYTLGGKGCLGGRQAIGSVHATSKRDAPEYAAMFQANADFIAAANPATVQQLIDLARRSLTSRTPAEQADKEARQKVAVALGLEKEVGGSASFAWTYLLGIIRECAKAVEEMDSSAGAAAKSEQAPMSRHEFWQKAADLAKRCDACGEYIDRHKFDCPSGRGRATAAGAGSAQPNGPTIDLLHISLKAIRDAYIEAFAPLPPELTVNDIDWEIIEMIKQRASLARSAQPRAEGAWNWKLRAEAAEVFLRNYADTNMEILLDGYHVQPIIRRLAAAILEWQTAALDQGAQAATTASVSIYVRQATLDQIAESGHVKHEITVRTEPNDGWVALALAPLPAQSNELEGVLRDMLAIQEACGLHTDEYAPGSVIEHIKELEQDQAQPVDNARDAARYRWLRDTCYDTNPAGEGDAFDHPALHFESDELAPYDEKSLDGAIDSAMRANDGAAGQEGAAC